MAKWFCWEPDTEALDEVGHAVGVDVQRESLAEFPELFGASLCDAAKVNELGEEALKALRAK